MSAALHTPSGASSPAAVLSSFDGYTRILSDYRHQDFPDLSSRRFAPDTLQSISLSFGQIAESTTTLSSTTIIAATARVLGSYCGAQDVLLGVTDNLEENLLPVRVAWDDERTWSDVIAGIAETLADRRWPRVHPDVVRRTLDLTPKQSPAIALVSLNGRPHASLAGYFPLVVTIEKDGTHVTVTAQERSLHPSQSRLFLSQVMELAKHAVADPRAFIEPLPPLSANLLSSYDKQPLEERRMTYNLVPRTKFAMDYLSLQAQEHPDSIAVRWYADLSTEVPISSYVPETMTNAELERKANQFGRWLLQRGLVKGRSVAVCMKRDIWFHVAMIGILRAGGCYVPIEPELPPERQQFICKDADVQLVLSTSDLPCFSVLGDLAIDVRDGRVQQAISEQSADVLLIPSQDDLSYLLYTSGTTGTPKGCILTHHGLSEAIWALSHFCASAEPHQDEKVNYLSIASVAFDVHIAEVLVAMAVGIPILSAPRSLLLEDLPYYIKNLRISHVGVVPSLIEATMGMVQADEDSGNETTLRYIASGGEKISDAILDKWASHPKVRLANFYGPSEVTIGCAARIMDKDTPRANIGRPFANVAAYVVDDHMNILLRGGTGELVVEGPLVGRGYVGRPDLTKKVFIPFPPGEVGRWAYRTGDLVRMMADGTLEVIGRIDTQIKLRGVRIESEGISSILRNAASPGHTLDAITILARHPVIGIDQLISFIAWDVSVPVAIRKGGKPSLATPPDGLPSQLRSASERELASYMRPSHIIPLDFIPLSSNGKADAKVLAAFFLALDMGTLTGLMSDGQATSPVDDSRQATEVEQRILEILEPYVKLPVERLGSRTNLFECGMDSLAVTRFAADLRRTFRTGIAAARVMQTPIVSGIAVLLDDNHAASPTQTSSFEHFVAAVQGEVLGAYPPASIDTLLPPFPVQEGVLYRSTNAPTMYVQHVLMRLVPDISLSALREAWKDVIKSHEMLRTVFHFGSDLVQVVLKPESCSPQIVETEIPDTDDIGFCRYFTDNAASDIARDLNANISQVAPSRFSFFVTETTHVIYAALSIHHALYDGISLPVLLQNLERAYRHQSQLPSADLREILDYIIMADDARARAFWSAYLEGFQWQRLLNRTVSSPVADITSVAFEHPLSKLQNKAAAQHVTLQALLMCAYGSLLAQRLYGHDDVVFGVIRAGRSIPVDNIETTVCPMITVVPARIRFSEPAKALQLVQEDIARVSEYEHIPLSRIQKWVTECDGTLFDTLFSVSFKEKGAIDLWDILESQNPEPDYLLAVEVVLDPEQDKAIVHAAFTSADISSAVVNDILTHLEETAIRLAEASDWRLSLSSATQHVPPGRSSIATPSEDIITEDVDEKIVSQIRAIASQFLRVDLGFVKADTSLLSLGLDSIKSVGLSRKFAAGGLYLNSADIMRQSTPLRLAAHVQQLKSRGRDEDRLFDAAYAAECGKLKQDLDINSFKLSDDDNINIFPTTVLQAGMLSQTISSHGRLYVHLFPLRLSKEVDIDRLKDAWRKAIAAFDILRTSFHFLSGPGIWVQVVHSAPRLQWSELQDDAHNNLVESLNPFLNINDEDQIFQQPPVFLDLLRATTTGDADRLVLILHHALYDGFSISQLFYVVEQIYRGAHIPVSAQYHQVLPRLLWEEKHGTTFWVDRLRNLRHAPIPRRSAPPSGSPTVHQLTYAISLTEEEISQACRIAEVTPQCIGQTAFAKLLAMVTRRRDVVFGRVVSGRDVPGAEEVIGPMLNTVPCRVIFRDNVLNKALLRDVHEANISSMPWQHGSLRAIQRELGISDLWDSLFVFQPGQDSFESRVDPLWAFDGDEDEDISIHYPLNIELHESHGRFVVKAACLLDVADADEFRILIEQYASILCDVVHGLDQLWSAGLPEIPQDSSPAPAYVVESTNGEQENHEWDSHFDVFRDILSTTTKVPSARIHPWTPLAALGVDSITAVQIVAKARRISLRLTAAQVVQSRTVNDLLKKIQEVGTAVTNSVAKFSSIDVPPLRWPSIIPSQVANLVERVLFASAGMEWMIGMWQRSKGTRFQHVFGFALSPEVGPARLHEAWIKLVQRHAILRSTFVYDSEAGAPRIVIFKPEALQSSWSQESLQPAKTSLAAVTQRMKELVSNQLPVDRPITRAIFLQSQQSRYLLICLHHFQYDAWSLPLLIEDLFRFYAYEEPRSSNDLESFLRYATSSPETEQEQEKYWKDALASPQATALFPSLSSGSHNQTRIVYTDHEALSGARALDARARELAISMQSIFLACWAQVQAKYTRTDDPVFSLWHSGRTGDLKDVERLAVPCINALPFRVSGAKTDDTLALARKIQDDLQARSAIVEQSRLAKVHEWAGMGGKPLSNVFVNIVKIAPDLEQSAHTLLESLDVPYYIPEVPADTPADGGNMGITDLVQDDLMVEIIMSQKTDQVIMSIESAGTVLGVGNAKKLLKEWRSLVKNALDNRSLASSKASHACIVG